MSRPKKISDAVLLKMAYPVICQHGFETFTLEQLTEVTGLSPAAFIKRFKTKSNLAHLARELHLDSQLSAMKEGLQLQTKGLQGLYSFLATIASQVGPVAMSVHNDELFKKKMGSYFQTIRNVLVRQLSEAQRAQELSKDFIPLEFSYTVEALIQGAILQFQFLNHGNLEKQIRHHITALLKPYTLKVLVKNQEWKNETKAPESFL